MKSRYFLTGIALVLLAMFTVSPVLAADPVFTPGGSDNATMYFNYAQLEISRGQYDKAVEYFDMALAENTTNISRGDTLMYIYKDKAAALADIGKYDDALTTVNAGLVQFKNSTGMWNNKGYILSRMGRYSEAVDAYTQAVTIDPKYEKGWINKGDALVKAGRPQEAVDAYNKALSLDPESSSAAAGLATAQKEAAGASSSTMVVLAVIVIIAAGIVVWYVKFRSPAEKKNVPEKGGRKE